MHKSMILGLSLVGMLFLAATTGMSMQVSAIQETEELQSFSGSKKHEDKKFVCRDGPLRGFYVVHPGACHVDIPPDPELLCEECIKYWLHFINDQGDNRQTSTLIRALAIAINSINFGPDYSPQEGCTNERPVVRGAECLPVPTIPTGSSGQVILSNVPQVFEICKQLDLALKYLDKLRFQGKDITPKQALAFIEEKVKQNAGNADNIRRVIERLFDCFEESLLPALFPKSQRPTIRSEENTIVQQDNQENSVVQQQSIDQQQQKQIEQIQQEIQQNLGQEQQQEIQQNLGQEQQQEIQKDPSSVSQEQMHQQQVLKLKQFLESVR